MALQLFKIASTTVESPVATIDFTSIPSGYTDLIIKLNSRTTYSSNVADSVYFSFNSSTANFSSRILYGSGSAAASFTQARWAGSQNSGGSTANVFSNIEIYIPNYTSGNNKSYSADAVTENNASEAYAYIGAGLWSNTAAITSITLTPNAGSFATNTNATLYGVL